MNWVLSCKCIDWPWFYSLWICISGDTALQGNPWKPNQIINLFPFWLWTGSADQPSSLSYLTGSANVNWTDTLHVAYPHSPLAPFMAWFSEHGQEWPVSIAKSTTGNGPNQSTPTKHKICISFEAGFSETLTLKTLLPKYQRTNVQIWFQIVLFINAIKTIRKKHFPKGNFRWTHS